MDARTHRVGVAQRALAQVLAGIELECEQRVLGGIQLDARDLTGFATDGRGRPGEGIGGTGSLGSGRGGRRTTAAYPDGPSTLEEEIREFYWRATVTRDLIELRNLCTVADLIVRCARKRRESRGLHYSIDYPTLDKTEPPRDTVLARRELV